jgi:hypothetical protein
MKKARSGYSEDLEQDLAFLNLFENQWAFARDIYCARLTTNFPVTIEMALNEAYDVMEEAQKYATDILEDDSNEEGA